MHQKRRWFWGVSLVVGLVVLSLVLTAGPTLWAAPGQAPHRQTVPPGTLTPTARPSAPPPTNPPPTNPPPTNPPPTSEPPATDTPGTPLATFTPGVAGTHTLSPSPSPSSTPELPSTVTVMASDVTVESTPTSLVLTPGEGTLVAGGAGTTELSTSATVSPSSEGGSLVEPVESVEPVEPVDTMEPEANSSESSGVGISPTTSSEDSSSASPGGGVTTGVSVSPLFYGGIGMILLGLLLLVVWRLRG